ncbi:MAG TPA: flagellar basal body P-ring protein FlgI [Tepidisphaeraceae bacterium]|jgi:hypothetical protein|nr:flagellar basal body P-ring protein FlgI [Tepidisphaeraceae bacterium]
MTRHPRILDRYWGIFSAASAVLSLAMIGSLLTLASCQQEKAPPARVVSKYPDLGPKKVPPFLQGSIFEYTEVTGTEPSPISAYGLVVDLHGTGSTEDIPTPIMDYMVKEMSERGFGSYLMPDFQDMSPEAMLKDKRVTVVEAVGLLPPGIRKGDQFDVYVQTLPQNSTTSLANGRMYLTDLAVNGADPQNPNNKTRVYGYCKGRIFINPGYSLDVDAMPTGAAKASLKTGVLLNGGVSNVDRPIYLQLRTPQDSLARAIERRIGQRFGQEKWGDVAAARDEGLVALMVPPQYAGDWRHFVGICTHLYLGDNPNNPGLEVIRARQLAEAAVQPNAPLQDIVYCWEGIGPRALSSIMPLLTNASPAVCYAAARAGALIGDPTGACQQTLQSIANSQDNPFQLDAVQTLGSMPNSHEINDILYNLLDSDQTLIRVEAYRILALNHDWRISSHVVPVANVDERFIMDIVPCHGAPLIYATRSGTPRLGIIGPTPQLSLPITFAALGDELTITTDPGNQQVEIFYRDPLLPNPVKVSSEPDIADLAARLGGMGPPDQDHLGFTYDQVLAILQELADKKLIISGDPDDEVAAAFMLQEPPRLRQQMLEATPTDAGRPQTLTPAERRVTHNLGLDTGGSAGASVDTATAVPGSANSDASGRRN